MTHRQCVILQGNLEWCLDSSKSLLADFDDNTIISLSNYTDNDFLSLSQKQAKQQLGKEFDVVIFDATTELNPDSLGAMMGTIKQGGVLILWLSADDTSVWLQRFKRISAVFSEQHSNFNIVQKGQELPQLSIAEAQPQLNETYLTDDQRKAVEAINKVVHGHRRRPLVLSADRGRGKSASLGIAAGQLLNEGKQTILVTAPSLAVAKTVFDHACRLLPDAEYATGLITLNNAEIRFIAPDALIESDLKADLLMVDEAAAIPASILEELLQKYARVVFSTTLHGYEGTGRGFAIRFQNILDQKTPDWRSYRMETPIRWADDDMLEDFSFQSLLMNASPVSDEFINDAELNDCQIEQIDCRQLLDDEQSLIELFGLMVLAHYRTRPSDLKMLLDREDITLIVARYRGHIVASVWLVNEGELGDELSQAIYEGKRRVKGHLLPQSLLAHAGVESAGLLKYQRVVRIAVHPAIQQRNIGQALLDYSLKQAQLKAIDVIGTSFAMDDELIDFWAKSAFELVKLGVHRDDVSGSHALMMLQAVSEQGAIVMNAAKYRFQQQWFHLLHNQFKQLSAAYVVKISQLLDAQNEYSSTEDKREIEAFAYHQRGYEFSQVALWRWLSQQVATTEFSELSPQQQALCVKSLLQHQSWLEIAKDLGFSGKNQAVLALRESIVTLLESNN